MQLNRFIFVLFVFFECLPDSFAQPVIEIVNDRVVHNIGKKIMVRVDESHQLSIRDILTPEAEIKFQLSKQVIPNIGITDAALWCKFKLLNKTNQDCYIEISNTALDSISVYEVFSDHSYVEKKSGVYVSFKSRELRNNNYLFRLGEKTDGVKTFYLRIRHSRGTQFTIQAGTLEGFSEVHHRVDFIQGIYFGFMLLIIFYNLLVYFSVRDASYLFYVLYVAIMTLMNASLGGYAFEFLWSNHAWLSRHEDLISASLGISGVLFAKNFLHIKQNAPFMRKVFNALNILFSAGIIIVLTGSFMLGTVVIEIVSLLLIIVFFVAAFAVLQRGYKPARFFLMAWSFLMLGVIVFILKDFDIIPSNTITVHSLQIGSALEALLLSFALADRINIYKKEKEKAQLDALKQLRANEKLILSQNEMLETKVKERTQELNIEKKKSDDLLLNILPSETAEELKVAGTARAKSFERVTVMFSDFKDFTQASEKLSPEELVKEINHCYSEFDKIISKYGIEKIKTIGDAYMCAGGLPVTNETHPEDVVNAALAFQHFIARNKKEKTEKHEAFFELRLGIHTGPVVAGIVGIKKFAYDIWGDTVNTASCMESCGEAGKVNISGATYDLVKDKFTCIYRGKIEAKHKGEIDMYFVEQPV